MVLIKYYRGILCAKGEVERCKRLRHSDEYEIQTTCYRYLQMAFFVNRCLVKVQVVLMSISKTEIIMHTPCKIISKNKRWLYKKRCVVLNKNYTWNIS